MGSPQFWSWCLIFAICKDSLVRLTSLVEALAKGLGGRVDDSIDDPICMPEERALDWVIVVNPKSIAYWSTLIRAGVEEEKDGRLPFKKEEEDMTFLFLSLLFLAFRRRQEI